MIRHLLTRKPRTPRPVDPEPLTRLDRLDGPRARYSQCDETCTADCGHCKGRRFGPYADPANRPRGRHVAPSYALTHARTVPGRHVAGEVAA